MIRERCVLLVALLVAWIGPGCARDPLAPDAGGAPCDADVQCAPPDASVCGAFRACVAGRCERADLDAGASGWDLDCR